MGTVRSTGAISVDHLANLRADGDPIICANSEALRRADHGALCGAKRYTHANSDGSADERADAVANGHPDHGPNTLPVSDTLGAPVARTHDRPHAVSFAHSVIGTHRRSHALPVDHVPVRVADTLADNRRTVGAANARANRCPQRSADLRANAIPVRRSVCIADICADDRPHFLPVIHPDAKPNLRTQSEPNRRTNPLSVLGQSFRGPDAFSVHTAPKCQSDAPANDLGTHSDADWLLHIDIDEALCPQRLHPADFFALVPPSTEQIFFSNFEAAPHFDVGELAFEADAAAPGHGRLGVDVGHGRGPKKQLNSDSRSGSRGGC